jgi:hypothetical protein
LIQFLSNLPSIYSVNSILLLPPIRKNCRTGSTFAFHEKTLLKAGNNGDPLLCHGGHRWISIAHQAANPSCDGEQLGFHPRQVEEQRILVRGSPVVVLDPDPRSGLDKILNPGKCILATRRRRMGRRAMMATETPTMSCVLLGEELHAQAQPKPGGDRGVCGGYGLAGDVGGLPDYEGWACGLQWHDS